MALRHALTPAGSVGAEVHTGDDRDLAFIWIRFALQGESQRFNCLVALCIWILRNNTDQDIIAAQDHAGLLVAAIVAEDEDLASQASLLDSHGCTDRAAVIAGPDHIDLRMSGQHVADFRHRIVLHVGADGRNLLYIRHRLHPDPHRNRPARLGLLGDLVVEVHLGNIDITGDIGFDEFGCVRSDDLAVGGIIGGVTTCQPGRITCQVHVGDGDLDALGSCFLQVRDGGILAQWSDGDAIHALGDVGLDQFSFLSLIVIGVGGQDLDAILGAGILVKPWTMLFMN